mgnify:CR=1 FL=1
MRTSGRAIFSPSRIRNYETIEVENFHNTKLHVSLGYYIDYSDKKVMDFIMKYRALFNAEPTQFAFQGYDIASYFISQCSRQGGKWMKKIDENQYKAIQQNVQNTENDLRALTQQAKEFGSVEKQQVNAELKVSTDRLNDTKNSLKAVDDALKDNANDTNLLAQKENLLANAVGVGTTEGSVTGFVFIALVADF